MRLDRASILVARRANPENLFFEIFENIKKLVFAIHLRAPGGARGAAGRSPGRRPADGSPGRRPGPFLGGTFRVNRPKTLRRSAKKTISELNHVSHVSHSQPAVLGKVVSGPRPGTTLLHAPGTKMT